ncbi:MAG: hypothetical protein MZV64_71110 [Ignavibacteriales bacterium]|nr:hypothetical protein [Ignavibacteriales bacterium]
MNTIGPGAVSAPVSRDIAQLDVLFQELNPKLKAQFLDITLDCCGLQAESSLAGGPPERCLTATSSR